MRNPSSSSSQSDAVAAGASKTTPCCSKVGLKRGPWTPEEDELLSNYINKEGEGRWRTLPKRAGLLRCGKSCRLRWMNYLRPSVKRGHIAADEEDLILRLHRLLGNRWSLIAGRIPGRTDNEIKNYWNTHLSKKLISQGIDPRTHKPLQDANLNNSSDNNHKSPSLSSSKPNPSTNPNPAYISDDSNSGVNYQPNRDANSLILPGNNNNHHLNFLHTGFSAANNNNGINACGESPGSFEDQDEDPNYCTDEVFSSFLNSLINEDLFAAQNQQQLISHYDASSSALAFGAAGWDAPPLMSTTTAAATAAAVHVAAFHHNPADDQPR